MGLKTWRAIYAAISLLSIVLIVAGYGVARNATPIVWSPPVWAIHVAILLTIPAFVLMAASFVSGTRIRRKVGHPLLLGVKIWALAHLLANGSIADILLFGAFLIWSVVAYANARRRDRKAGTVYVAGAPSRDVIAVVAGLFAWIVFALWLHRWLIGVAPLQMMAGA
jgi:uncharacterized membrane protein